MDARRYLGPIGILVQEAGGRCFRDTMPAVGLPFESHHEYAVMA